MQGILNPVNIDELVDIQDVTIDMSLTVPEKKESLYRQMGSSDCFRFDDIVVRFTFLETGVSFEDRVKQYLLSGQGKSLVSY
jgi:hypothetical protein